MDSEVNAAFAKMRDAGIRSATPIPAAKAPTATPEKAATSTASTAMQRDDAAEAKPAAEMANALSLGALLNAEPTALRDWKPTETTEEPRANPIVNLQNWYQDKRAEASPVEPAHDRFAREAPLEFTLTNRGYLTLRRGGDAWGMDAAEALRLGEFIELALPVLEGVARK